MARRRSPQQATAAEPVDSPELPEPLRKCYVEDWLDDADAIANAPDGFQVDGSVTAVVPPPSHDEPFGEHITAFRRWHAARWAWGLAHGISQQEFGVRFSGSGPRRRTPPETA